MFVRVQKDVLTRNQTTQNKLHRILVIKVNVFELIPVSFGFVFLRFHVKVFQTQDQLEKSYPAK